ncbi:hypothetical protein [Pueribacillus sp. YX66]|uniref:hypothetical protein n=1 Tax=Pueribacillus sp. YX66 TaxID=3229242 RepID=UPI00358D26A6
MNELRKESASLLCYLNVLFFVRKTKEAHDFFEHVPLDCFSLFGGFSALVVVFGSFPPRADLPLLCHQYHCLLMFLKSKERRISFLVVSIEKVTITVDTVNWNSSPGATTSGTFVLKV